jgi:preprotein translocase subunit SecE
VSDPSTVRGQRDDSRDDRQRTGPATFLRQVIAELRKVVWPTRDQLVTYFIVVMVFVMVMMLIISALDLAFGRLVFAVFGGGGQ